MLCPTCGTENLAASRFCGGCGGALSGVCGACGAPVERAMRFCTQCGARLGSRDGRSPAIAPSADPVAERRLVSVLFADLVGFTTVSEARDPEDVRELLTRYFDACRSII